MITKTKLLLLGTVFSLGATSLSFAADLPRKAPAAAPVYPPPVATWAGCYIGGTVGAVNNRVSGNVDFEGFSTSASGNKTGGIYGGYLGCNWQNSNFVYGIEGDFSGIGGSGASQGFPGSWVDWCRHLKARLAVHDSRPRWSRVQQHHGLSDRRRRFCGRKELGLCPRFSRSFGFEYQGGLDDRCGRRIYVHPQLDRQA